MATNKKFSQLDAVTSLAGSDIIPVETAAGVTSKITQANFKTSLNITSGIADISGQDLSTADNSTSAFITLSEVPPVIGMTAVADDTAPVLGGGLDGDGNTISNVLSYNGVVLEAGTGELILNDNTFQISGGDVTIVGSNANTFTFPEQTGTVALIENSPQISSGTSAPSSTPTKVGDIFIDTSAKKLYFAVGISASTDWTIAN